MSTARSNDFDTTEELQKKLKRVETDKKAYQDESNNVLRQQKLAIKSLREDNERLKEELSLETKQSMVSNAIASTEGLTKLQDAADHFTKKVEHERKRIEEMERELKTITKKTLEQRQKMGGVHAVRDANKAIDKQIRVLENRLEKALTKFNESLASNKKLREDIDNLRRERVIFDGVYRKLERELQENKKEMAQIVETSNIAYEARDQAHHEMNVLRAMADKEQIAFEAEWRELGKAIEEERKQRESQLKAGRGDMGTEEESKLKKKIVKGAWNIAKDRAMQQSAVEKVRSYEEAFERIKEATGITDIEQLVNTFIEAEDQNYALFNYVNELNSEIEKLEEQIAEAKSEIDKYKGQGMDNENQRKKILKDLEDKLERTAGRVDYYRARSEVSQRTIDILKSGIQTLFFRIGCNSPAAKELLGDLHIDDSNMMQFLGVIEQRTNEVVHAYVTAQLQNGSSKESTSDQAAAQGALQSVLGTGPSVPTGAAVVHIEPPSGNAENDSDEDEEDEERPLSRDELKQRTLASLSKRENKSGGGSRPKGKKK